MSRNTRQKKKTPTPFPDPFAEREAQKYENPIPSREAILQLLEQAGRALKMEQIARQLGLAEDRQVALERRLGAMVRDGRLIQNRKGAFGVAARMDLKPGRVLAHPDGFGFFRPDEGGEDVFLNPKQMRKVLHGDRVLVAITGVDRRGRPEGAIVEVLEHVNRQLVGRFEEEDGIAFVVPDDKHIIRDILISRDGRGKARPGDMVLVRITRQPSGYRRPVGEVIDVVGKPGDPGMAVELSILSHGLPLGFPDEVLAEAEAFDETVPEADWQGREDLRRLPLMTIDGADARDFDDAVFCKPEAEGWTLYVAIADVASYVMPDSPLDKEAYARGTSAYFPNKVVPMLPEKLSNGLCSLNPEVDRLYMVCQMQVDPQGHVTGYRFYPAVMRSRARLTYDQVAAALNGRDTGAENPAVAQLEHLRNLHGLYQALAGERQRRGALDFDSHEVRFVFDEAGHLADLQPLERNVAHRMIEECMIAANVCAARLLEKVKIPAPFRNHEPPPASKLEDLVTFLHAMGLKFPARGKQPTPQDFAAVLEQAKGREDFRLIQMVLLRSQSLAVYGGKNLGHFGLGLSHYTHFTSPIRRYADLLVHRALHWHCSGLAGRRYIYDNTRIERMAEHCSQRDRTAEEASREAEERLKCLWLSGHVGEVLPGQITGVTSFGLFVELDDSLVSGLVHVTSLPNDYYHFDPVHHRLAGERSGRVYRLGDRVRVQVMRVDVEERKVDFNLAGEGDD